MTNVCKELCLLNNACKELLKELVEAYQELLNESKNLYAHYPNNVRITEEEYFESENALLKKFQDIIK
jgi:hypothetical protein